jgi:hypothetical protein
MSNTETWNPCAARSVAHTSPLMPPPTTATVGAPEVLVDMLAAAAELLRRLSAERSIPDAVAMRADIGACRGGVVAASGLRNRSRGYIRGVCDHHADGASYGPRSGRGGGRSSDVLGRAAPCSSESILRDLVCWQHHGNDGSAALGPLIAFDEGASEHQAGFGTSSLRQPAARQLPWPRAEVPPGAQRRRPAGRPGALRRPGGAAPPVIAPGSYIVSPEGVQAVVLAPAGSSLLGSSLIDSSLLGSSPAPGLWRRCCPPASAGCRAPPRARSHWTALIWRTRAVAAHGDGNGTRAGVRAE